MFADLGALDAYKEKISKKVPRPPQVFRTSYDAEIACRFLRHDDVDADSRRIMAIIFEETLRHYPKDAQVILMYTYYLSRWGDDPEACLKQLTAAKLSSPSLDVRFRIYMEERDFEQAAQSEDMGVSHLYVSSYAVYHLIHVEYQSLERQATRFHLTSLMALKGFTSFLLDVPLLENMYHLQRKAMEYYTKLTTKFPRKHVFRKFAKFLITDLAVQYLKRADDIEETEEMDFRERANGFFMDQTGMGGDTLPDREPISNSVNIDSSSDRMQSLRRPRARMAVDTIQESLSREIDQFEPPMPLRQPSVEVVAEGPAETIPNSIFSNETPRVDRAPMFSLDSGPTETSRRPSVRPRATIMAQETPEFVSDFGVEYLGENGKIANVPGPRSQASAHAHSSTREARKQRS
ncbi:uncharacterized protein EV422DRAFT_621219 [Fimicolochytrium jonesii]|uniref:uncharacterized protein n=1 Tax=Fimicolochytrium jonesii TaxID=1396493 RepID=UPI0022FEB763|nr:uncharacterized protein EV422DRAFT_621219 [Fimicolochytrium jonesii]KAI8819083.1 hypothetical protein EV422DRAFT_621219 [Fimicolochytrium jonesii]